MEDFKHSQSLTLSYLTLRMLLGYIGLLLPFALPLTNCFFGSSNTFQPSVSHYYYSVAHIVFVGTLCFLGCFLICYKGKVKYENAFANFCGLCAIGIAVFPTSSLGFFGQSSITITPKILDESIVNYLHIFCAFVLFSCFATFCFYFFQKSDIPIPISDLVAKEKKRKRNVFYNCCGFLISSSMLLIFLIQKLKDKELIPIDFFVFKYSTFLLEAFALWSFGASWLLKSSLGFTTTKIPFFKNFR